MQPEKQFSQEAHLTYPPFSKLYWPVISYRSFPTTNRCLSIQCFLKQYLPPPPNTQFLCVVFKDPETGANSSSVSQGPALLHHAPPQRLRLKRKGSSRPSSDASWSDRPGGGGCKQQPLHPAAGLPHLLVPPASPEQRRPQ